MNAVHHLGANKSKHKLIQREGVACQSLEVPTSVKEAHPTLKLLRGRRLRIGFVPLNDCAPIVMACEKGFFAAHGLRVSLHRELGWATIRDKIIYRELDAAHALAAMPLSATLGIGSAPADCLTSIVLNLNGNAITLSEALWKRGVRNGASLQRELLSHPDRSLTFGVVSRYSSHHLLLRSWLEKHGISEHQVRVVVLPPSQMASNLSRGNLDGFCVGEPWNSITVRSGTGWIAAISPEIDPGHPEKVLMMRSDFAESHQDEHLALNRALMEACAYCDDPRNTSEIATLLASPQYVGAPADVIKAGLNGAFPLGHGQAIASREFCIFHRDSANEPTLARAAWTLELLRKCGPVEGTPLNAQLARKVFRSDLYHLAANAALPRRNLRYDQENQLTAA